LIAPKYPGSIEGRLNQQKQKMSFHILRWRRCPIGTEVDKELIYKLNENYSYINTSTPLIPRQRGTRKYIMTGKLIAAQSLRENDRGRYKGTKLIFYETIVMRHFKIRRNFICP